MKLFGLTISKALPMTAVPVRPYTSWFGPILESFAGAWQKNVVCETTQNILAFSAVYACVALRANDISKLRIKLVRRSESGTWDEFETPAYSPVLRKPNPYQTRIQFLSQWMTSKLLHGNTYVIKQRDQRNVVVALYVLDPKLVTPLVASEGSVFYRLQSDTLSGLESGITVPASEIIHDRMITLWHPLIGVSPIYACGSSATQGIRIQANSAKFFENMSRPSIHLSAPGSLPDEQLKRLKEQMVAGFSAENLGRVLVTTDGMKMDVMTIPASDAQLIEQQRWTVEDVARAFHVPLHKLGMGQPTLTNIGALNQDYYNQTLQIDIESIELLLDEGLSLPSDMGTELDLDGLLRMDPLSMADAQEKGVRAGIVAPDEARLKLNLTPVPGGAIPYLQQQNFSLEALAKRDAQPDPFATTNPPPALPSPTGAADNAAKEAHDLIRAVQTKFDVNRDARS